MKEETSLYEFAYETESGQYAIYEVHAATHASALAQVRENLNQRQRNEVLGCLIEINCDGQEVRWGAMIAHEVPE